MIDIAEYTRFLEIEARLRHRLYKEPLSAPSQMVVFPGDYHQPKKYDYFLHPRFGVVCALDDGGGLIDKTPVCEALDRELFGL